MSAIRGFWRPTNQIGDPHTLFGIDTAFQERANGALTDKVRLSPTSDSCFGATIEPPLIPPFASKVLEGSRIAFDDSSTQAARMLEWTAYRVR
jgi:hypothetical protein